ncbi:MAG TPA: hypothetical protein VNK45_03355 [Candidatus Acidoferrales bacterium]|nr:hypothetical protein [Candidatus Acidoferrales bacterium]
MSKRRESIPSHMDVAVEACFAGIGGWPHETPVSEKCRGAGKNRSIGRAITVDAVLDEFLDKEVSSRWSFTPIIAASPRTGFVSF